MNFKGILFDLDGTLVDSSADIAHAANRVLGQAGLPTHPVPAYDQFVGNGLRNTLLAALPENYRKEAEIEPYIKEFMMYYKDCCTQNTQPYKGVPEMLQQLKSKGLKLGVLSNKATHLTQKVVQSIFPGLFDCVQGLNSEALKKPNPHQALQMAEELNIPPANFMFIGDTDVDMITADRAGMYGVGVLWGYRSETVLRASGAKVLVQTPEEIIQLVTENC